MDEDVFLVFVPFGLVVAAVAVFFVRNWEAALDWDRFRPSTLSWTTMVSLIVLGFMNMSDSAILLAAWLLISGAFIRQVFLHADKIQRNRHVLWALFLLTPGGWILYFTRFPHFHGLDAEAARLHTADRPTAT